MHTCEISLSKGKAIALVDDSDFEMLSQWKWSLSSKGYAKRTGRKSDGVLCGKDIKMHRQILGVADPLIEIDHADRNKINNKRSNLRVCSRSLNVANSRLGKDSKLGYKGIVFDKRCKYRPWQARIKQNGTLTYLGYFPTREEAAKRLFGEFACLNEV